MDRQKKLLIFGVSLLSAGLLTWFLYANTVAPKSEKQVAVIVASHDMPLGTLLRASDVKLVRYPERDAPRGVVLASKDAVSRVALVPFSMNEPLLATKLSAPTSTEGVSS